MSNRAARSVIPRADTSTGSIAGLGRGAAEEDTEPLVVGRIQAVHLQDKDR